MATNWCEGFIRNNSARKHIRAYEEFINQQHFIPSTGESNTQSMWSTQSCEQNFKVLKNI